MINIPNVQNTTTVMNWIQWYNNEFKSHHYYKQMANTTEGSKFHRESSVAVHTDMVVMNVLRLEKLDGKLTTEFSRIASLFAAAFHDVGKPSKREAKYSEERGDYFSFNGHEMRSARLWEDFYMQGPDVTGITVERFGPEIAENFHFMFAVGYMIEHHRPWGLRDQKKIDGMLMTMNAIGVTYDFFRLLLADNMGRISDDPECLEQSIRKIDDFKEQYEELMIANAPPEQDDSFIGFITWMISYAMGVQPPDITKRNLPEVIIPIAASGSGKSSLFNFLQESSNGHILHHSMDSIRAELYGDDPAVAFRKSVEDSNFQSVVQQDFIEKLKTGKSVYVDNTNISRKRRRFYVDQANRNDYDVVAILLPATMADLMKRQRTRPDKFIPYGSVMSQYLNMSYPTLGLEFDGISFANISDMQH